jgi:nitroreductase
MLQFHYNETNFSTIYAIKMGSVYETICSRRTIRRFLQKRIPERILEKMINAARLAPSGSNLQPCEYIVVNNQAYVQNIFQCVQWAAYIAPKGDPSEGERPVCYIIVLVDTERNHIGGEIDAAAAIENILLTGWQFGIGSCWMGSVNREEIKKQFNIPDRFQIHSVIALGYPNEAPQIEVYTDSVAYWKDEEGVLHVPKRRLKDIYHKNGY